MTTGSGTMPRSDTHRRYHSTAFLLRRASTSTFITASISTSTSSATAMPPDLVLRDFTSDLPDDLLALILSALPPADRNRCSLVCRRWLSVDALSRHRLSLDARADLFPSVASVFSRFSAVRKLSLKCDRRSDSIADDALDLISLWCPNLTRLKLRSCRLVTDTGMAALAGNCPNLRKLSVGSCAFGVRGISAVASSCRLLEELSIKRLRGLTANNADAAATDATVVPVNSTLRSISLKELYNGQCFGPIIAGSPNLKTLRLFRCSGSWDILLEGITKKITRLVEVHLEKIQITDKGLAAVTACSGLEILRLVKTPECTDVGISSVAYRCQLLRKIHIDGMRTNRIGDEGLSAIARRCPNLQELVLIGINPTSLSIEMIAGSCGKLERLALCSSETIGDAELSCIAMKCVVLKKLCIKGCPISNHGMQVLAEGCPNLVKLKLKKCPEVTSEGLDLFRIIRGTLAVCLDTGEPVLSEQMDASASESGMQENGVEQSSMMADQGSVSDLPSNNGKWSAFSKVRLGLLAGRSFMASTLRRWSHSRGSKALAIVE